MTSYLPLERIYPNPANVREDLGDLGELTASLRSVGVLQPLVVRPVSEGFLLVDGHRRYEAAHLAGLDAVPCLAIRADAVTEIEIMLASSLHRQLEPIEQARAFSALLKRGLTPARISERTGYSVDRIQRRLRLLALPTEVQEMVEKKSLSLTHADSLARQVAQTKKGEAPMRSARPTYLNAGHPLASQVREACTHRNSRAVIGGTGCGQCWEHAITTARPDVGRATDLGAEGTSWAS